MSLYEIEFFGNNYLLIGNMNDGAIATKKQYENFECSFAHLCPDGKVRRFHCEIGTKDDIKIVREVEK